MIKGEIHRPVEEFVEQILDYGDKLERLSMVLTPAEKVTLYLLIDGMGVLEQGQEFKVTRQAIEERLVGIRRKACRIWGIPPKRKKL